MRDSLPFLTALFAASVVLANVLAAKLTFVPVPGLGGVAIPAGFLAFGIAYLASDLIVELHGRAVAHRVVNGTIAVLLLAYGLIAVAIALPAAPFYEGQGAFASVLGGSASITLASVIALALAQHLDVRLFDSLRTRSDGRHRWLRNCGSTGVSQLADTVLFITLGFAIFPLIGLGGQPILGWSLVSIIAGQYAVKLAVAGLDTVPFYVVTEVSRDV